jgi:6-phosphogluconolactonase/glucosamine-6-phosphate isomerase/deaminase
MQLIKTDSPDPAAEHIARILNRTLRQHMRVLWLVSGGSSIEVAVQARKQLLATDNLMVMQVDERFGPVGHKDSNWQQLAGAGFDLSGIDCRPMLTGDNADATAKNYDKLLKAAFNVTEFSVGLFGIGTDGHTAGILPGSPAADSDKLAVLYQAPDFQRVTITPAAIAKLDVAIIYAAGDEKAGPLIGLRESQLVSKQPAQALKLAKNSYVYNNHIEESI